MAVFRPIHWLVIFVAAAATAAAGERPSADPVLLRPLPEGLAIHARIIDPERIETHPLVQRIVSLIETSREWDRVHEQASGLFQLSETLRFLDNQLKQAGVSGGIRAIWKRGAIIALGEGEPPRAGGIMIAQDESAAQAFIHILRDWGNTDLPLKYTPTTIDGTEVLVAGDLHVAVLGQRVAWGNHSEAIQHVLQHLKSIPSDSDIAGDPTLLADFHVSLPILRKNPDFVKTLEEPKTDFGLWTFLGGWIDLVRRHERLSVGLHAHGEEKLSLKVVFRDPTSKRPEAIVPFFVHDTETIAPPLAPPGVIQSFSWYRDYASLWNNRSQLFSADMVNRIDKQDDDAGKMMAVFGTSFKPSELVAQLGPHYRVVMTEQEHTPYRKVEVENVYPAAAFVVDLRDEEKFRKMTEPLVNLIGLIQGGEQHILTVREEYKEAKTISYIFLETDEEVKRRTRDNYNFQVTGSITRGHFILGTTPGIVHSVIDELDHTRDKTAAPRETDASVETEAATEFQILHFPRLARQLGRLKSNAVRKIVFDTGWTIEQAEHEYQIALDILGSLGDGHVRVGDDAEGFGIEVLIGGKSETE